MSIVKRGNSKNWYIHFQFNGETFIKSSRTTIKKVAEQMEIEWRAQLHAETYQGRKQRITLLMRLSSTSYPSRVSLAIAI